MCGKKYFLIMAIVLILISIGGVCASDDSGIDDLSSDDSASVEVDESPVLAADASANENITVENNDEPAAAADSESGEVLGASSEEDVLGVDVSSWDTLYSQLSSSSSSGKTFYLTQDIARGSSSNDLEINYDNIVIDGSGYTIDASRNRAFVVYAGAKNITFQNIDFTNGYTTGGYDTGGAFIKFLGTSTNVVIQNCNFSNAEVNGAGTAVLFRDSYAAVNTTVRNCIFSYNKNTRLSSSMNYGGAITLTGRGIVVDNCTFIGQTLTNPGGGTAVVLSSFTTAIIKNCNFHDNTMTDVTSDYSSGTLFLGKGLVQPTNANPTTAHVTVTNCNFTNNHVSGKGGAISFSNNNIFNCTVSNCYFINNSAAECGGAIYSLNIQPQSDISITNCNFTGNKCNYSSTSTFRGGGAIFAPIMNVSDCNFTGNSAGVRGGAILVGALNAANSKASDVTISNCRFDNNVATYGTLTTRGTVRLENNVEINSQSGYMVCNEGDLYLSGNHFNSVINTAQFTAGSNVFTGVIQSTVEVLVCGGKTNYVGDKCDLTVAIVDDNGNYIISTYATAPTFTTTPSSGNKASTLDYNKYVYANFNMNYDQYTVDITSHDIAGLSSSATTYKTGILIKGVLQGSYTWLQDQIDKFSGSVYVLNQDITFDPDYDLSIYNVYYGTINFKDGMNFNKVLTFDGNGHTISGLDQARIFNVLVSGVTFENTNFVNGSTTENGGAIFINENQRNIYFKECNFTDNAATKSGGAIYFKDNPNVINQNITIEKCNFDNNQVFANKNNDNDGCGGAVYLDGEDHKLIDNNFTNNRANGNDANGGAIFSDSNNMVISNNRFINNYATYWGGAFVATQGTQTLNIADSYFYNNSAINAAAVDIYGTGDAQVINCLFDNNVAINKAAGIYANGVNGLISHCNFTNNKASKYSAIAYTPDAPGYVGNTKATITYCNFINNTAANGAATVRFDSCEGNINHCNFTNNTAASGAGIYVYIYDVVIEDCIFTNNNATNGDGGAIQAMNITAADIDPNHPEINKYDNITVRNCVFNGNHAEGNGGAVYMETENSNIVSCDFTNNTAKGNGGAIYLTKDNQNITFCNFTNNKAAVGGAIYLTNKQLLNVSDSIFKDNTAEDGGAIYYEGNNNGLSIYDDDFIGNNATFNGGAVYYNAFINNAYVPLRDYNMFDGNAKGTSRVSWNEGGAQIIYSSYFKGNMDYLMNASALDNNLTAIIYVTVPRNRFDETKVKINVTVFSKDGIKIDTYVPGIRLATINGDIVNITLNTITGVPEGEYYAIVGFETSDGIYKYKEDNITLTIVDPDKGDFLKLQERINKAIADAGGQMAYIDITEDVNYHLTKDHGQINITGPITITGIGNIQINAYGKTRIFDIRSPDVVIKNIKFVNGNASGVNVTSPDKLNGGAILWEGVNGILENCTFEDNYATEGGAVFIQNNAAGTTITNSTFGFNTAVNGGAIGWNATSGSITGSTFTNNTAVNGGAINAIDKVIINGANFNNNSAVNGGAINVGGQACEIKNSTFTSNNATNGAAILLSAEDVKISNSTFDSNTATNGAVYVLNSNNFLVNDTKFTSNKATTNTGAIFVEDSNGIISNSTFTSNEGAIYITGQSAVDVTDSTFNTNTANSGVQDIYVDSNNDVLLYNLTINNADGSIGVNSDVIIKEIKANGLTGSAPAIEFISGNSSVINSTFDGNKPIVINNGAEVHLTENNNTNAETGEWSVKNEGTLYLNKNNFTNIIDNVNGKINSTTTIKVLDNDTVIRAQGSPVVFNVTVFDDYNNTIKTMTPVFYCGDTEYDQDTPSYNNGYYTVNYPNTVKGVYVITVKDNNNFGLKDPTYQNGLLKVKVDPSIIELNITQEKQGEIVIIKAKLNSDENGNVTFIVNGEKYSVHIEKLELINTTTHIATLILTDLTPDDYTVNASYNGDDTHFASVNPAIKQFTVYKRISNITITVNNIIQGQDAIAVITSNATQGNVTVIFNNEPIELQLNASGEATWNLSNKLAPGNYSIYAFYDGNKYYDSSKSSDNFTVYAYSIKVEVNETQFNQNATIRVTVNPALARGGNLEIYLDDSTTPLTLDDEGNGVYSATTDKLIVIGEHKVNVTYTGNATSTPVFPPRDTLAYFNVTKASDYNLTVNVTKVAEFGDNVYINVTAPAGIDEVNVTIGGATYPVPITNGEGQKVLDNLTVGDYTATVSFAGNDNYEYKEVNGFVSITKADPAMTIIAPATVDPATNVTVTVVVGKNATKKVFIYVNGNPTPVDVKNGNATLTIRDVQPGTINVTAEFIGDSNYNYAESALTQIKVDKYNSTISYTNVTETNNNVTVYVHVDGDEGNVEVDGVNYTVVNGVAEIPLGVLSEGDHTYEAIYYGDSNHNGNRTTIALSVGKLNNATVKVEVVPGEFGDNTTIKVTVPKDGDGNVTIFVDGVPTVVVPDADGVAILNVTPTVGNHTIKATYTNSTKYNDAESNETNVTIEKDSHYDFNVVIEPKDNVKYGDNVSINVTGLPNSEVAIIIDGVVYDTVTLGADGKYSVTLNNLTAGSHTVVANYSGNGSYDGRVAQDTITIGADDPEMIIKIVPGVDVAPGSKANITVFVGKNATGTAIIYINGTPTEVPVVDGVATLPIDTTVPGTYNVTAKYLGDDGNYVAGVNNTGILYTIEKYDVSLENKSTVIAPNNEVTFTVKLNVTDAKGDIVYVEYDGKNYTGVVDENGFANVTVGPMAAGDHNLNAVYNGSSKYATANVALSATVGKLRNGTMDISIVPNPGEYGQSVNITVTIPDVGPNDGNVTVNVNGTPYPAKEVAPGVYEVIVPELPVGDYPINVTYANGSKYDEFKNSTTMSIGKNSTYEFSVVVEPKDNVKYGDDVSINVTGIPGSEVDIIVDGVVYDTVTIGGDGKASKVYNNLTAATHTIVANYSGNGSYEGRVAQDTITIGADDPEMIIKIVPSVDVAPGSKANITVFVGKNATGTAIIYINGTPTEVPVVEGVATLPINTTVPGTYNVTAKYLGDDGNYATGVNNTGLLYTIEKYDVSLENKSTVIAPNNEVTFTVQLNVTDAKGDIVYVEYDGKNYTGVVDENGFANVTVGPMAAGDYNLNAVYNGSSKYATANVALSATVGKLRNGTMDISIVPNPGEYGQSVNITVTIPDVGPNDGNVTVNVNGTPYPAKEVAPGVYEVIVPELPVGDYPINVTYANGSKYDEFKNSTTMSIGKNSTYEFSVVVEPKDNVKYGDDVRVNVTGIPGSEVDIIVDGVVYDTVTIGGDGKASKVYNNLTAATHTIVANYSGNGSYEGRVAQDTITIGADDPEMIIEINPGESVAPGSKANITVFVGKNATGTAIIYIDSTPTNVPVVDGVATLPIDTTVPGKHNVTAMYLGDDGNYAAGVNNTGLLYTIEKYDVSLENKSTVIAPNNEVTFTVKLNVTDAKGDIVYITYDGKNYTGVVDENGFANVTVGPMAAGDYNLNAVYNGSSKYATANVTVSATVGKLNNGTMDININPSPAEFADSINITVTIPDVGPNDGNVTVLVGNTPYPAKEVAPGVYEVIITDLPVGDYPINVTYANGSRYNDFKDNTTLSVEGNSSYEFDVDVAPAKFGEDTVITVTAPAGVGQVNVTVDDEVHVVDIDPATGKGTLTLNNLSAGNHNVTASFAGNNNYSAKNTTTEYFPVDKQVPSMEIIVPAGPIDAGSDANIVVKVGNNATGNVTVFIDNVRYEAPVKDGVATLPIDTTKAGTFSVTAQYLGDENYESGTNNTAQEYTVDKYDIEMTYTGATVAPDNTVTFEIAFNESDASGEVTIDVNGKTYTGLVNGGVATVVVGPLAQSDTEYKFTAVYSGDEKYNSTKVDVNVTVNKLNNGTMTVDLAPNPSQFGDSVNVTVTIPDVTDGTVNVKIGDKTYPAAIQPDGTYLAVVSSLPVGDHVVNVTYSDGSKYENFYDDSQVIHTDANGSYFFDVDVVPAAYGNDTVITVTAPAGVGQVNVTVDGETHIVNIDPVTGEGTLTLNNISAGSHEVTASFDGNKNYTGMSVTKTFTVPKQTPEMDITVPGGVIPVNTIANITVIVADNATGDAIVYVDGVPITVKVENGIATVPIDTTKPGVHNVTAKYFGDENYTAGETAKVAQYTVGKYDTTMEVLNITRDDDNNVTVKVKVNGTDGNITVKIGDKIYNATVGDDGIAEVNIGKQDPGALNDVNITYSGDDKFAPISVIETIDVPSIKTYDMPVDSESVKYGQPAQVNVTLPDGANVDNLTFYLNDVAYDITGKYEVVGNKVVVTIDDLKAGDYTVKVAYADDGVYGDSENTTSFTVEKADPAIKEIVVNEPIDVGEPLNITVKLPEDATGTITVNVNGTKYTYDLVNGSVNISIPKLGDGSYPVNITYSGDDNYDPFTENYTVDVNKVDPQISANASEITLGENAKINVTLPSDATGTVTIKIEGVDEPITAPVSGGTNTILIPGVPVGTHSVEITYNGDSKYAIDTVNTTLSVVPKPTTADDFKVEDKGNGTIVVTAPEGATGEVNLTIGNETYTVNITDGKAVFNIANETNQTPGVHDITLSYAGDENHTGVDFDSQANVPKWDSAVSVTVPTIREGDVAKVNVTVTSPDNRGYVPTGNVRVVVDGKGYTGQLVDGSVVIEVPGLDEGPHEIAVYYDGDDYYLANESKAALTVQEEITAEVEGTGNNSKVVVELPKDHTENVTVLIDGVKYNHTIDENGTVKVNLTGVVPGEHNLVVKYVDENGTESIVNKTIIVPKWDSSVNATAKTIREGDVAEVVVTVGSKDMTGNVTVKIDGTGYVAEIVDGTVTIPVPGLTNNTYDVTVTYSGNDKYLPSSSTFQLTVQAPIAIDINGTGNSSQVVIDLPGNGTVEAFIDGNKVNVTVENGTAKVNLTGIEPGKHNLTVVYTDEDGTQSVVTQEIIVPPWDSSVNATAKTIREGDVATIVVKVGSDDMTGRVIVDINGTGYYADVVNGEAIIKAAGLKEGVHVANVTYEGNDKYLPSNNTVTVTVEAPIVIDINGTGNASQVVIDLPGNGTVDAFIDGNKVNVTVENGTAKVNLTGLEPGKHNITVVYTDEDGTQSVVSQEIIVPPWDSSVNATAKTIREGDVATIVVKVGSDDMTGRVTVDIDGTGYYAEVVNGEAIIKAAGLKEGIYVANVTYEGNDKYLPSNNTVTVTVEAPIVIDINGTGNSSQVVVDLPANGTDNVTVLIDGKDVPVVVENGTAKANLTGLEPGEHNITVIYTDADGTQSIVNQTINVPKWDSSVNATAKTIREGDVATIVVKVGSDDMTGRVTVDIDGTGYYAEVVNGEAIIKAAGLKEGIYVANVTYEGNDKYLPSNNTVTVTVEAPIVIDINGTGNSSQVVVDLPANGTDNVTVLIDGKKVPVVVENGTAKANLTGLEPGEHNITVIYTDADGTQSIVNQTIEVPKWDSSVNATAPTIREGDDEPITINLGSADMTGTVTVDIDGTGYYANITNGIAEILAPGIKAGSHDGIVRYLGDDKYLPSENTFTFTVEAPIEIDVEGAGNSTEVIVKLPENGTDNVTVYVDGKPVNVTVSNGTAVADLNNITPGEHNITVVYTDKDGRQSIANKTITVYISIKANDMTRGWGSLYDYEAEFLDKDGHVLANTTMQFKVDGKTYQVMTDNKGIAKLNESKLPVGKYEVEITNTLTGEVVKHNLTIVKRLIENKDVTLDFLQGKKYVVRAIGDDGKPVGAGEIVKFRANGINYAAVTDKDGYAKLTINLNPGKYTITAQYAAYKVSNKIKVKQTLKLVKKTVKVKKTAKKLKIKAKLKWSNGKPIKGKKLVLKFKGKKYSAKTNKKGIAKFTIKKKVIKKLKKGKKYKYTVSYKTNKVKGKIKVKK